MMENEKEQFEFEFAQHKHEELLGAIREISFRSGDSEALKNILQQLEVLTKKEFLPEFSAFQAELASSLETISKILAEKEEKDEQVLLESLAEMLTKTFSNEIKAVFTEFKTNIEVLKKELEERNKPKKFRIVYNEKGRISEVIQEAM